MADHLSKNRRSWLMSRVKSENTSPELAVRQLLHSKGFRFRLHKRDLPGRPDIVLPKYKAILFVHGCFWHRHKRCVKASVPKTRTSFWKDKFAANVRRDRLNIRLLEQSGWRVLVIWQCEIRSGRSLDSKLRHFFSIQRRPTLKKSN